MSKHTQENFLLAGRNHGKTPKLLLLQWSISVVKHNSLHDNHTFYSAHPHSEFGNLDYSKSTAIHVMYNLLCLSETWWTCLNFMIWNIHDLSRRIRLESEDKETETSIREIQGGQATMVSAQPLAPVPVTAGERQSANCVIHLSWQQRSDVPDSQGQGKETIFKQDKKWHTSVLFLRRKNQE